MKKLPQFKTASITPVMALSMAFLFLGTTSTTVGAAGTMDFSDFKDALSLDGDTTIDFNSYNLSTSGSGGLSFGQKGGTSFMSDVSVGSQDLTLTKITPVPKQSSANSYTRAFSPDGKYMVVGGSYNGAGNDCVKLYQKQGDSYTDVSDMMRYSSTNPAAFQFWHCESNYVGFSDDGQYLMVATNESYGKFYVFKKWSDGTLVKVYDTELGFSIPIKDASFSPNGNYLAVASLYAGTKIYKRSLDSFTLVTSIGTSSTANGWRVEFSPDGNYVALAEDNSSTVKLYKRQGDTFTLQSQTLSVNGRINDIVFSQYGNQFAVAHESSPYLTTYTWSNEQFTQNPTPANPPSSRVRGVNYSVNGNYLALGYSSSPYMMAYKRNGTELTKLANPSLTAPSEVYSVVFSPQMDHLFGNYLGDWTVDRQILYKLGGNADVQINGGLNINGNIYVKGNTTTLQSALIVAGKAQFDRAVRIGSLNSMAGLEVLGDVNISGGLNVDLASKFNGQVVFGDSVQFNSQATFSQNSIFQGQTSFGGILKVSNNVAGKIAVTAGTQYIPITYGASFGANPIVNLQVMGDELTTVKFNQYVVAGTCPNDFNQCRTNVRTATRNLKYSVIEQHPAWLQIGLESPATYDFEIHWIALGQSQ